MRNALIVWIIRLALVLLLAAGCTTPPPTPTPTVPPTDVFCPPPPNWYVYTTQPGDTLPSLAARTSTTVSTLELANCLNNPRGLMTGQVFYLPRKPITP